MQTHSRPFVVDPRLDPRRCPRPTHRQQLNREVLGKDLSLWASRWAQTRRQVTSHPALLSPPKKCLFAYSFGTYGSAGEKGEVVSRVIRLQKVPKDSRWILMSQLWASLAVSFRKSSSFMQRRKQMEITELIWSEETAFWKNTRVRPHYSRLQAQGQDKPRVACKPEHAGCRPVPSAEPHVPSSGRPGSALDAAAVCPSWVGWRWAGSHPFPAAVPGEDGWDQK